MKRRPRPVLDVTPAMRLTEQTVLAVCSLLESRGLVLLPRSLIRNLLTVVIGNGVLKAYRSGFARGRRAKA